MRREKLNNGNEVLYLNNGKKIIIPPNADSRNTKMLYASMKRHRRGKKSNKNNPKKS